MNRLALPLSLVTGVLLLSGAAVAPESDAATWWATAFYWIVAAGALIYLVLSRRGDKKTCRHEENAYATAERKRRVRADLLERAVAKRDDAASKVRVLTEQGADADGLARANEDLERDEGQVAKREAELAEAQQREDHAKAAVEQCRAANAPEASAGQDT